MDYFFVIIEDMSILVNGEIKKLLDRGDLSFKPNLDKFQFQQHSVDLRLGFTFMVPRLWDLVSEGRVALNMKKLDSKKKGFEVITLEEKQYFEVLPGEYVIVSTLEQMKLPSFLMGVLYPRSSVNRRGLSLDLTGIIDAGYEGSLIVPVRNNTRTQTIRLYPGERFCQIVFHCLSGEVEIKKSRYHKKDVTVEVLGERSKTEMELVRKGRLREVKSRYVPKRKK